jgi:hypothetical protein
MVEMHELEATDEQSHRAILKLLDDRKSNEQRKGERLVVNDLNANKIYRNKLKLDGYQRKPWKREQVLSLQDRKLIETGYESQVWFAACKIQCNWRGHKWRVWIWKPGGIGQNWAVVKIQRVYRGMVARRWADVLRFRRDVRAALQVQCAWRSKKSRRFLAVIRAVRFRHLTIRMQARYRGIVGTRIVAVERHKFRTRMAQLLQRVQRSHKGRTLARNRRKRIKEVAAKYERAIDMHLMRKMPVMTRVGRVVSQYPYGEDKESQLELGLLLQLANFDYPAAKQVLKDALRCFPNDPAILYSLASLHLAEDDPFCVSAVDEAMVYLGRAKELDEEAAAFEEWKDFFIVALKLRPRVAQVCSSPLLL